MASSDNVVRAGFTPKFKDVDTLTSMLTYSYAPIDEQKMAPTDYAYVKLNTIIIEMAAYVYTQAIAATWPIEHLRNWLEYRASVGIPIQAVILEGSVYWSGLVEPQVPGLENQRLLTYTSQADSYPSRSEEEEYQRRTSLQ